MLFYEKVKPTDPPSKENDEKKDTENEIPDDILMTSGYDVFEPDVQRSNNTHRWQTFLFDSELQGFLKELLGRCTVSSSGAESVPVESWRGSVVQMLLSFVFDIFFYASEKPELDDWIAMLDETMNADRNYALTFLAKLASKTREVSGNWLRTYLSDCPDRLSRSAAVRIFSSAMRSAIASEDEQVKLKIWTEAWRERLSQNSIINAPLPYKLDSPPQSYEGSRVSSTDTDLGSILSLVNVLIEQSTRNWRFTPELCMFIRDIASHRHGANHGDT